MKNKFCNYLMYCKTVTLYCLASFLCIFRFQSTRKWLISERGNEARDNGYFLFRYIKKHNPEIEVYFVISPTSRDYYKLRQYSKYLIKQGSFKHYLITAQSRNLISTHMYGAFPDPSRFKSLHKHFNFFHKKKIIHLRHGVSMNYTSSLKYPDLSVDLLISGAKREYEFLIKNYNHPEGVIQLTGLPRYDSLLDATSLKRQILFMPTWRRYLSPENFSESAYFKNISQILEDERIAKLLEEKNFKLVFYPHFEVQKYLSKFLDLRLSKRITIADFTYDVQDLLKESAILITDYSSVYIDFAYMKKPVLLYAFDESDFYSLHYSRGEYDGSIFGTKSTNFRELFNSIEECISSNCVMPKKFSNNVDTFFGFHDACCCRRVVNLIKSL